MNKRPLNENKNDEEKKKNENIVGINVTKGEARKLVTCRVLDNHAPMMCSTGSSGRSSVMD